MRKLFAALLVLGVLCLPVAASAQANVTSDWVDGNLVFYDASGNVILTIDGTNRRLASPIGVGAAAGTGVAASEYGTGDVHSTTLTLTALTMALTDQAGAIAYVGTKVYDFPAGAILILGATADIDLTKSSAGVDADWNGDFGLGTATAAADDTLTLTEDDILPTTATPEAVAGVTTSNGQSTAAENVVFDGTTTAKDLYLNYLVDDADHDVTATPCNLIANGTITLHWVNLGDY